MKNVILGIETAVPSLSITQKEAYACAAQKQGIKSSTLKWYERFMGDRGIETRHFALDRVEEVLEESRDASHERFRKGATQIGAEALRKILERSGVKPESLDGLVVTTCTGYLCQGLTSYISEVLGLRADLFAMDLAGLGCGAALPALRAADQYLSTHPESYVAVVSVEICSAAIYWDDTIDLILSNSIFGDGAAACLLTNVAGRRGFSLASFSSVLWPQYREDLRFKTQDGRLRNVISRNVPAVAARAVQSLMADLMSRSPVGKWRAAVHPGGRLILDEIEKNVTALEGKLERSRSVLRRYGNMSSPSVLFVLKDILELDRPGAEEAILLFAFGAGFSAYGALLRMQPATEAQTEKIAVKEVCHG